MSTRHLSRRSAAARRVGAAWAAVLVLAAAATAVVSASPAAAADAPSDDASLSSLSVDGVSVEGFSADVSDYRLRVGNHVASVTVAAVPTVALARAVTTPGDAEAAEGHQVDLVVGDNTVEVEVTATDGVSVARYRLIVRREVPERLAEMDINYPAPRGPYSSSLDLVDIWSDGETIWFVYSYGRAAVVWAFDLETGARRSGLDVTSLDTGPHGYNHRPRGVWADGEIMWIVYTRGLDLYAYSIGRGRLRGAVGRQDCVGSRRASGERALGLGARGVV